jgi:hippurate hydrolase
MMTLLGGRWQARVLAAGVSTAFVFSCGHRAGGAPNTPRPWLSADVQRVSSDVDSLYVDLHKTPELSGKEDKTAALFASRLRSLGLEVTAGVGGHGVVGLLRNGAGPTIMLRTELDGLPVEEKTGLAYASHATAVDESGETVHVMHACGHDVHIAALVGALTILSHAKDRWRGTIMAVGQPAEENLAGARAMIADGLFTRFPRPDYAFSLHVYGQLPTGQVAYRPGPTQASADFVRIEIHGKGGHGAAPQATVDPVVIAARTVIALQTLVSRENDPLDPAVLTVGVIRAGTRANVVPDDAELQLSLRTLRPEVRKKLLAGISRVAKSEAAAAGAVREPTITVTAGIDPLVNDPALTRTISNVLAQALGPQNVVEVPPWMTSDDFAAYGQAGIRAAKFFVGGTDPAAWRNAQATGVAVPNNHSPLFAPERRPTLDASVHILSLVAFELLGKQPN